MRAFQGVVTTPKTTGGLGSVFCCCITCCLWPWPDPDGTPKYPATDLPDTVTIDVCGTPFTLTRSGYNFSYLDAVSGINYEINATIGITNWVLSIQLPAVGTPCQYAPGVSDPTPYCLVNIFVAFALPSGSCCASDIAVTDNLLHSYHVDLGGGNAGDVARDVPSGCTFSGGTSGGDNLILRYDSTTYDWRITVNGGSDHVNIGAQNDPTGTYDPGSYVVS